MKIILAEDMSTKEWSGGTTTEIFIYPENANYQAMNFDFRISTATIEVQQSTFTKLPGVKRTLMVLDGTLELQHKNQHQTILEKYEKDNFSGDWETISGGFATDFNLMIKNENLNGFVRHLQISKKKEIELSTQKHGLVFIHKGTIVLNNTETILTVGDAVYFNEHEPINISGISNAVLIFVLVE